MLNSKKTFLFTTVLTTLFLSSCAKKLPDNVSEDIQQNVFPVSLFNQEVELAPKEPSSTFFNLFSSNERKESEIERGLEGIYAQATQKEVDVEFKGPSALAVFFKEYKLPVESLDKNVVVFFRLTKNFLVAYADLELKDIKQVLIDGKLATPLFQYPIAEFGILEKAKNDLGEETRDILFKSRDRSQANQVKINTLVSNRQYPGLKAVTADKRKEYLNIKALTARTFNGDQIKSMFKFSKVDIAKIRGDREYKVLVHGKNIYLQTKVSKYYLSGGELALAQNEDPRFEPCQEKDCYYVPLFAASVTPVLFTPKNDGLGVTAEVEETPTVLTEQVTYVKLPGDEILFEMEYDKLLQDVYPANLFNQQIELAPKKEEKSSFFGLFSHKENKSEEASHDLDDIYATSTQKETEVEYRGPWALAPFFKEYKLPTDSLEKSVMVSFKLTKNFLVAYADIDLKDIKKVEVDGKWVTPLFQYALRDFGVLEWGLNDLGENARNVYFKVVDRSRANQVKIYSMVTDRQYPGLHALTADKRKEYLNTKAITEKSFSGKQIRSIFNFALQDGQKIDDNATYKIVILGQYLYVEQAVDASQLNAVEQSLAENKDPRFAPCAQGSCVYRPLFSVGVTPTLFKPKDDGLGATADVEEVPTASAEDVNFVKLSRGAVLSEMNLSKALDLKNNVIVDLTKDVDFDSEYVYLPSTLGTPREVTVADPFYQGDEKIVKIKRGKEGLEVYEIEKDPRFSDNTFNHNLVLTIPGKYLDLTCAKDELGKCTPGLKEENDRADQEKRFFVPYLSDLKVTEVNTLNVFTANDGCVYSTGAKATSSVIKNGVFNLELIKGYRYSPSEDCIIDLFFDDNLKAASFDVAFYYSMVRLKDLASKDYTPVLYPSTEHDEFGFFKDENKYLDDHFDGQRLKNTTFLNRYNPNKKVIDYYLTDTFYKAQNSIFLEATKKAMDGINRALQTANAGIQINLVTEGPVARGHIPGDLRNNMIVLIDDPLSNGLLGYAPTVSNPRTGEILQGHVNMYSGTIFSMSRSVYESMVDLSIQLKNEQEDNKSRLFARVNEMFGTGDMKKVSFTAASKSLALATLLSPEQEQKLASPQLNRQLKAKLEENLHKKIDPKLEKTLIKEGSISTYEAFLNHCSKNNAFHKDFFNLGPLGKTYFPGIVEIAGIKNEDGTLKRWKDLSDEQKNQVGNIIAPAVYTSTLVHEFGHNLGLRHNFLGSFDKENFYSKDEAHELGLHNASAYSSIMDYSFSELNELSVFGKYDVAALRFAYAREVVKKNGDVLKVESTLTALQNSLKKELQQFPREEQDKHPELQLKKFLFCTDENAGLSSRCNRFDEGTSLSEVAQHTIDKYKNYYQYRNFRDGRDNFTDFGIFDYAQARFAEFKRMRNVLEDYENFVEIFGEETMNQGCSPAELAKYPICKEINDYRDAVRLIGDFFIEVLATPDHLCEVANKNDPKEKSVKKLSKLYEEVRWDIDYIPQSCFDPAFSEYLAKENLVLLGEAGKFLTDFRSIDPVHNFKNDLDIRGVWSDKLLAMKFLVNRNSMQGSSEDMRSSLMDVPYIGEKVTNVLRHLALGEELESRVPFVDKDGKAYETTYQLPLDEVIPEIPYPQFMRVVRLPKDGSFNLTEELLKVAQESAGTTDPKFKERAKKAVQYVSVIKKSPQDFVNAQLETLGLGDYIYQATNNNVLAMTVMSKNKTHDLLKTFPKATLIKVIKYKSNPPMPTNLSAEEVIAYQLPGNFLSQLLQLAKDGAELNKDFLVRQFGEEMAKKILAAYGLGAEGLQKIVDLKLSLATSAPEGTPENEAKLYAFDIDLLKKEAMDVLGTEVEFGLQALPLYPAI